MPLVRLTHHLQEENSLGKHSKIDILLNIIDHFPTGLILDEVVFGNSLKWRSKCSV